MSKATFVTILKNINYEKNDASSTRMLCPNL